jgi:hypothetical protein
MESPLFDYYSKNEITMLENIRKDKNEHGYKITSMKMFKVEVAIMTDVIKYLNSIGVYVLYVYDALLCEGKDKALVIETMNRIVLEHGVMTCVKVDEADDIEPQAEPPAMELPKYKLEEVVHLYEVLPMLSFSVADTIKIILDSNHSKVKMTVLVDYLAKQNKSQKYNDYDGVPITADKIVMLKKMIYQ